MVCKPRIVWVRAGYSEELRCILIAAFAGVGMPTVKLDKMTVGGTA
jgi:hypothetical protein